MTVDADDATDSGACAKIADELLATAAAAAAAGRLVTAPGDHASAKLCRRFVHHLIIRRR